MGILGPKFAGCGKKVGVRRLPGQAVSDPRDPRQFSARHGNGCSVKWLSLLNSVTCCLHLILEIPCVMMVHLCLVSRQSL